LDATARSAKAATVNDAISLHALLERVEAAGYLS
jgi:hypothetical protein